MKGNLLKWSTLGFLSCFALALGIACVWTGSYWMGDSWMAKGTMVQEGYWGAMGTVLSEGDVSAATRFKMWLFIAAPLVSGLLALAATGLIVLRVVGKRVWPFAAGLATLSLLGTWLGMSALRGIEDPIFFAKSPWVSAFQRNAYPVAVLAACYLLVVVATQWAARKRAEPVA